MVENFGNYLKHERELRGIPLQEIADNTKIPMRFLQALENNDLDELPGEVFIKGYIRSYAKILGTNVDEILATFNESVGKAREEKKQQQLESERHEFFAKRRERRNTVFGILVVLLILGSASYLARLSNEPRQPAAGGSVTELKAPAPQLEALPPEPEAPAPEPSPPANPVGDVQAGPQDASPPLADKEPRVVESLKELPETADSTRQEETGQEPLASPDLPVPAAAANPEEGMESADSEKSVVSDLKDDIISPTQKAALDLDTLPLELTIRVEQQSWFELLIDGVRTEDFILPAGTGKTFKGKHSFKITIGNRNGTRLYLNGEELALPESSETENNVVRDFLVQMDESE